MFTLCFASGATCPLRQQQTWTRHVCSPQRAAPRLACRKPIVCAKDSSKGSSRDRPLPQGFGKSSSSSGEKLAFVGNDKIGISFTCDAAGCGERITKSVRRKSYEKGTVLIQCPKCERHHIIADNIGMYAHLTGGRKNVEELARDAGVAFTRVNADAFRLDNAYWEAKNLDRNQLDREPDSANES